VKIKELTERQKEVYNFIKKFTRMNGYPPTIREVSKNFGFSSPSGSLIHIKALQKKGYIERVHASRGIRLISENQFPVDFVEVIGTFSKSGKISLATEKRYLPIPSEKFKAFAVESRVELPNFDILAGDYVIFEKGEKKPGLSVCQIKKSLFITVLKGSECVTLGNEKHGDFENLGSFYGVIRIPHKGE